MRVAKACQPQSRRGGSGPQGKSMYLSLSSRYSSTISFLRSPLLWCRLPGDSEEKKKLSPLGEGDAGLVGAFIPRSGHRRARWLPMQVRGRARAHKHHNIFGRIFHAARKCYRWHHDDPASDAAGQGHASLASVANYPGRGLRRHLRGGGGGPRESVANTHWTGIHRAPSAPSTGRRGLSGSDYGQHQGDNASEGPACLAPAWGHD